MDIGGTALALYAAGGAALAGSLGKLKSRLELSKAKHRSLAGHSRMARRFASLVPFYEYDEEQFFCSDDPPAEIAVHRRAAFARLSRLYRERFEPSARRSQPELTVCVAAICADSDEEAERLASSTRMAITLLRRGQLIAVPSVEKALAFFEGPGESVASGSRRVVVGTPETVRSGLEAVAEEYGADEVLVVTITHDHEARKRSYELLAGAFGLTPACSSPLELEQ